MSDATSKEPTGWGRAYPAALAQDEETRIGKRRARQAGLSDVAREGATPIVGLSLSGGGIRSATFGLGVIQALAKLGLLRRVDYLSTVSGGGYIGSFLGALFARAGNDMAAVVKKLAPGRFDESAELRWLRQNGRYLAPNGGEDLLAGVAAGLRGWLGVMTLMSVAVVTLFLALQVLRIGSEVLVSAGFVSHDTLDALLPLSSVYPLKEFWYWSPLLKLVAPVAIYVALPVAWAFWAVDGGLRGRTAVCIYFTALTGLGAWALSDHPLVARTMVAVPLASIVFLEAARTRAMLPLLLIGILAYLLAVLHAPLESWIITLLACAVFMSPRLRWSRSQQAVAASLLSLSSLALLYPLGEPVYMAWVTLLALAWAVTLWRMAPPKVIDDPDEYARRRLTSWLATALLAAAVLLGAGLLDSAGQTVYALSFQDFSLLIGVSGIAAGAALLSQRVSVIKKLLDVFMSDSKLSVPSGVLIWVVAIIATAGTLCLLDTASHALAWNFAAPFTADAGAPVTTLDERVSLHSLLAPLGYLAILIFYCVVLGRGWAFVNRSSHHGLYAARLNRTYLGASNPARTSGAGQNVTSPVQGDDFDMGEYWSATAHDHGAPLHLVNVTVNQTVSARSGTLNRDRKGLPMCIGPSALSGGVSHHYLLDSKLPRPSELPPPGYWMFLPRTAPTNRVLAFFTGKVSPKLEFEKLSLGQWVAISGAAFTTGAGYQTTLATSLLTGLGNIRLGYWWNSGSGRDDVGQGWFSRTVRWAFPVQMHLFDEFTANFRGPHEPYWYLSDGGHFENMAAYEMIRRRLPVIVIVDGEADPNYTYEGLANLVRKARTDFGAEIEFLSRERLDQLMGGDRGAFGELSDLRFDEKTHLSNAHAAIARVTYSSDPSIASIIIYLKPTLMRDIPADVREYQENNPPFPQQPTLDQFFDEMQWESYRRLGEHVGERAFARTAKGAWSPGDLRLPPKPDPKNPGDEPHPFWR